MISPEPVDPTVPSRVQVEVPDEHGDAMVLDVLLLGPPDGEPVLLLHGFPQHAGEWAGVWPGLVEAGYRVLAPDQRGYSPGARPLGVERYRTPLLAADAAALLTALDVQAAHVVGHDWGAAVTWHLAARHPDRVLTATCLSVPHPAAFGAALRSDPDQRARSAYMLMFNEEGEAEQRLLADDGAFLRSGLGGEPLPHAQDYVARLQQPGALTAALSWYRAQAMGGRDPLPPITAPVLHVWSDGDHALGPVATLATASYVQGPYRLEILHGVDHWIPERVPGQVVALLLEHLGGRGGQA